MIKNLPAALAKAPQNEYYGNGLASRFRDASGHPKFIPTNKEIYL
jgi:hypothetical protein